MTDTAPISISPLKARIQEDLKAAMKSGDKLRLGTLRILSAALKQREVDERIVLTDTDILALVEKQLKQRREAETQFRAGNRPDLADNEALEASFLTPYLPQQLTETEVLAVIDETLLETHVTSAKDMGKLMAALKPKVQGKTDMAKLSALVKTKLV
jgi:hypothetical protein